MEWLPVFKAVLLVHLKGVGLYCNIFLAGASTATNLDKKGKKGQACVSQLT